MAKNLVIVESPAKARTIKKYLGKGYDVQASVGHIKDLPKSKLGVDVEKDFEPTYVVIRGKAKVLKDIVAAAKKASAVYLAPDPDREGEAIAWHIASEIQGKAKKGVPVHRIRLYEITKKAVEDAISHPLELDVSKFESQQARRIVDRLVGYTISPILWDKVRRGLSAGRVQSVAVRIVVERERLIQAFEKEEYWSITARLAQQETAKKLGDVQRTEEGTLGDPLPGEFDAKLFKIDGEKFTIANEDEAKTIVSTLESGKLVISGIEKKERKRHPAPPFITSKLQQEAARKLRYSPKRTMSIAQRLYEGIELGDQGPVGLITYMRTDSTRVADSALESVREHIETRYGAEFLPEKPRFFKQKKGAQDAHEAIRPTSLENAPDDVKRYLKKDELALYTLIWNRFVASQMTPAVYDQTAVDITVGKYTLRATGSILKEEGFIRVYTEGRDDGDAEEEEPGNLPASLAEGEELVGRAIQPNQHFTQPPPRFTEASLVKELEENGIGRPSTYASILSVIQDKEYVTKDEQQRLVPSELGFLVTDLLTENFPTVMDVEFTAGLEEELDQIEEGKANWKKTLRDFYVPFAKKVEVAKKAMRDVKAEMIPTDLNCEKCGSQMVIRWGRRGQFLACSAYPECKNTADFRKDEDGKIEIVREATLEGVECPTCGAPMTVKNGRFGRFIACTEYPDCKTTKPFTIDVSCPKCKKGKVSEKRSRRGKTFYGCARYPDCDFVSWYRPRNEPCPQCGADYLVHKFSKKSGAYIACLDKACGYRRQEEEEAEPASGDVSASAAGDEATP